MAGALGCALLCLVLAACFQKNFLDLSVDGRPIGMRAAMSSACCLLPEELSRLFLLAAWFPKKKNLFEKNFLDLSVEEAHWDAHCYACLEGRALGRLLCLFCVLPATPRRKTLFEKNFLDLSVEGRAFGKPTMPILCAACHPRKKNFIWEELSRPFCGGTRIWEAYYAYSVCCLPPQEEKLYLRRTF